MLRVGCVGSNEKVKEAIIESHLDGPKISPLAWITFAIIGHEPKISPFFRLAVDGRRSVKFDWGEGHGMGARQEIWVLCLKVEMNRELRCMGVGFDSFHRLEEWSLIQASIPCVEGLTAKDQE